MSLEWCLISEKRMAILNNKITNESEFTYLSNFHDKIRLFCFILIVSCPQFYLTWPKLGPTRIRVFLFFEY